MSGTEPDMSGPTCGAATSWFPLSSDDVDEAWNRLYERFQFVPCHVGNAPGIREPEDSVTYDISHAYGSKRAYRRLTNEICYAFVDALCEVTAESSFVTVLDWQHPCYRYHPHSEFVFSTEDDWPVPPLPNGDYYIFLAPDMSFGVFGHPWQQTMCVWGQRLIEAFQSNPPALFAHPIRVGGQPVR